MSGIPAPAGAPAGADGVWVLVVDDEPPLAIWLAPKASTATVAAPATAFVILELPPLAAGAGLVSAVDMVGAFLAAQWPP